MVVYRHGASGAMLELTVLDMPEDANVKQLLTEKKWVGTAWKSTAEPEPVVLSDGKATRRLDFVLNAQDPSVRYQDRAGNYVSFPGMPTQVTLESFFQTAGYDTSAGAALERVTALTRVIEALAREGFAEGTGAVDVPLNALMDLYETG